MTKTRRLIIELLDTLVFAVIFYAIFATIVYSFITHEFLSFPQTLYFVALVAVNFCMRRVCFTNWFRRQKRDFAKPVRKTRLEGAQDIVGAAYKPTGAVVTQLGLKLTITHLITLAALIFMLPFTAMGAAWFILAVAMSAHSVWFALRKKLPRRRSVILTAAVIFIAMSFWMASVGSWFLVSIYTPLMLFVTVGRLIVVHMVKVDGSLKSAESSSQQSIGKIIAFNYKLLCGFALVFSGIVVAVYFALMRPILVAVGNAIERLPAFERGELTREEYFEPIVIHGSGPDTMSQLLSWAEMNPARTNHVLNFLLTVIFGGLLIALFVAAIYHILRVIFRWLNMRATKGGTRELLSEIEDEKEFIGLSRTRRVKRAKAKKEHALRRLFRETVQKYIKTGVPIQNTDTPTEMTIRVRDQDFDSLADEYSRVRYGDSE